MEELRVHALSTSGFAAGQSVETAPAAPLMLPPPAFVVALVLPPTAFALLVALVLPPSFAVAEVFDVALVPPAEEPSPPVPVETPPVATDAPPPLSLEPQDALMARTIEIIKVEATRVVFIVHFSVNCHDHRRRPRFGCRNLTRSRLPVYRGFADVSRRRSSARLSRAVLSRVSFCLQDSYVEPISASILGESRDNALGSGVLIAPILCRIADACGVEHSPVNVFRQLDLVESLKNNAGS